MRDRTLEIPEHVLSQSVQDETVLLDLKQERYYGLDEVGGRVWQLIAAGVRPGQLAERLLAEYDVEEPQLHSDLHALIEELVEAGLLEIAA
jgi:hypothetical protein